MKIKEIRWSREAAIAQGSGFFSAFQANSFVARVEYEDGFITLVACPRGAAAEVAPEQPIEDVWGDYVRSLADSQRKAHNLAFNGDR